TYVLLLIRGIKLGHVLNHYFLHFHVFASIYPFSSSSNRQMLLQQSIDSHITQICSLRIESALGCRQRLYEGEAAMDQEDKMVVPPRKEPEVEKKQKPEHEPESEFEKKRRNTKVDIRSLVRKTQKGEFQVEVEPINTGSVEISVGSSSLNWSRPKNIKNKTLGVKNELNNYSEGSACEAQSQTLFLCYLSFSQS
uniref:Uncharacterized protein n=1 Tax=Brassica oleracea var. oleracea TaxID=109376 RepID=A0A0D3AT09_BRAOL